MDRVYESGASNVAPTPPAVPSIGFPSRGNPGTGTMPTVPGPYMMHSLVEEIMAVISAAAITPDEAVLNQLKQALDTIYMSKNGTSALLQNFAGLTRSMTPLGGGLIREYVDVTNAATVGGIEIGVVYNCAINTATGVWDGRDIADICWMEKWHDVAGTKEFWFAPTGVANAVPVWTKIFAIDMVNGTVTLPTPAQFDNSTKAASTAFIKKALGSLSGNLPSPSSITLTLADIGKLAYFYGATIGQIFTLPAIATIPAGYGYWIVNQGSVPFTVKANAAETIYANTYNGLSGANTLVLSPGDSVMLSSSGSLWDCFGSVTVTGTFTMTGTGFAVAPTVTVSYKIINGVVFLTIPWGGINGTSNATTFTLTGLPTAIQPSVSKELPALISSDAGVVVFTEAVIAAGTITLNKNGLNSAWTASGVKRLWTTDVSYSL